MSTPGDTPTKASWLGPLLSDLRFGLRQLRRSPGFTATAMLTLALGIGATTAVFTLFDAVMLKALPVREPAELYRVGDVPECCVTSGLEDDWSLFSFPLYESLRDHTPEFRQLAAFQAGRVNLSTRRSGATTPAEAATGEFVSGNYFSMFGVGAFAGRMLAPSDDVPGAAPAAVLSHHAWERRYAPDTAIVGSTLSVDGQPFTVVGIAPRGFFGDTLRPDPPDFFLPIADEPILAQQSSLRGRADRHWLELIGRFQAGALPAAAEARMTGELRQWLIAQPDLSADQRKSIPKQRLAVVPGGAGIAVLKRQFASGLNLLLALSTLLLLIACANIASLLLARGTAQRAQIAVRLALGAGRWRLLRQKLTESALLGLAGGAAGLLVAFGGTRGLLALAFQGAHHVPIDPLPSLPVLGFAFLVSLSTGLVFGIAPAWLATRFDPADTLRGGGRSTRDTSALPQRSLVIAQTALSFILLAGAGLLSRSLARLEMQQFGFATTGRLIVQVDPMLARATPERLPQLYRQIEQRLGALPGVERVGLAQYTPLTDRWTGLIFLPGRPQPPPGTEPDWAAWERVSPHYLDAIGQPVLRGRPLGERDDAGAPRVALVNEAFARKYLPGKDPLGQRFGAELPAASDELEIVGVVGDAKYNAPGRPAEPMYFLPLAQSIASRNPSLQHTDVRSHYIRAIVLRLAAGAPAAMGGAVRSALAEVDPNLTVLSLSSPAEAIHGQLNQERLIARLTGCFGLLALLLASVGLYGVTSYSVARRTAEIGIRMALGADRGAVVGMVLRGVCAQLGWGLAIGLPAALAGGRLIASQLFGVRSWDPPILAAAVAVLIVSALFAGLLPAQRAATIDPLPALRTE
ncbi:MAG TPA: ABC transporter permease [Thermoanaerobaculia bacterium]|nr:ABC transporter permease [Thermoanaerobaculia bacterium]